MPEQLTSDRSNWKCIHCGQPFGIDGGRFGGGKWLPNGDHEHGIHTHLALLVVALAALFWTRQFLVALTAISILFAEASYFWRQVGKRLEREKVGRCGASQPSPALPG